MESYISVILDVIPMNQKAVFALGLVLALAGAALMLHGSLLGERTVPAAITVGIVGLLLIATSRYRLLDRIA